MEKPVESSAGAGSRKWIVLLTWMGVLVIVGSGISWQLYRILPGWIEDSVGEALLDRGVVLTEFPVEDIGISQSRVGPGSLVYESHSLSWNGIWADYKFTDALEGHFGSVLMDAPRISIQLPERHGGFAESELPVRTTAGLAQPAIEEPREAPVESGIQVDQHVQVKPTSSQEDASLWKSLQDLKFGALRIKDGVIDFSLLGTELASFSLEGELVKEPIGVFGQCLFESDLFSSQLSLRAPAALPAVTLQGNLVMPVDALMDSFEKFRPVIPISGNVPSIVSSGEMVVDLLLELDEAEQLQGSAEIELRELVMLESLSGLEFSINNLITAGYYKDGMLKAESGAEVLLTPGDGYRFDSFGLRMSLNSGEGVEFESETFAWDYQGIRGKTAFRGTVDLPGLSARMEIAFSELVGDWLVVEPFSILVLNGSDSIQASTSEIGARKMDTIWLEELKLETNNDFDHAQLGFTWYDTVGVHMGDLFADYKAAGEGYVVSVSLNEPGKAEFLSAEYSRTGESSTLEMEGKLLPGWFNSLASWWGGAPAKLTGGEPDIQLQLSGLYPFYSGQGKIDLDGLEVELDGGTRLKGISGSTEFAIAGIPMIPEMQQLTIDSVSSGQFELQDVQLDWAMPLTKGLEIIRFEAKIGGGSVALDPFILNPLKPAVQTRIHINGLQGNQLLEWLGETRFSVEGSVSGRLAIGWQDGEIILGDGILQLDSDEHDGRFIFEDPAFLQQQFESFGGIQDDLKNRFLDALLDEGIEIHSLEISLGAAPEPGKILLRLAVSGETRNEMLEVPIEGFIINNVISGEDLGRLMGLIGPVRILTDASGRN